MTRPSIADLFAARLADLEARSAESDAEIARHLARLHEIAAELDRCHRALELEING